MSCSDDDLPLAARARGPTAGHESDSDDDVPLSARVPSVTTTKPKPKNKNNSGGNKLAHKRKSSATEDYSSGDDEPIGSLVGIPNGKP